MLNEKRNYMATEDIRRASCFVFAAILILFSFLCRSFDWRGTSDFHTIQEVIASLLALVVGALILVRYYAEKEKEILYIALGFIGTAIFDAYHGFITCEYMHSHWLSPVSSLAPWSWNASRLFLALFMFFAWFAWRETERGKYFFTTIKDSRVYLLSAACFIVTAIFFVTFPFPRAYYPEYAMGRPEELVSGALFLLAMIGYYRKGSWKDSFFSYMFLLSLIVNFITQTFFMSFSLGLFDTMFTVAHGLKIVSYGLLFLGGLKDIASLFSQVKEKQDLLKEEILKREDMEEQLIQTQKMEAIGQLAGGVAHDFNNQLLVIDGYCDFLLEDLEKQKESQDQVREIKKACERSAFITRQLLAFSRKQVVHPQIVNLNDLVSSMMGVFKRLIPTSIKLEVKLCEHVEVVELDPIQLEHVLTNMVVNARDAMPDGGELLVETQKIRFHKNQYLLPDDVPKGEYGSLVIRDNGVGIPGAVQARVFEPFFTTKEQGKGTGLGLSTSYGIIKQCHGFMHMESKQGKGTTFQMYFPSKGEDQRKSFREAKNENLPKGNEKILLVEDEAAVLALSTNMLKRQGYGVIGVSRAKEALELLKNDHFDLLVTDVVMPEMNGYSLYKEVKSFHPKLKVLFVSGYMDNNLTNEKIVDEKLNFLPKPFSARELAFKVRRILDEKLN